MRVASLLAAWAFAGCVSGCGVPDIQLVPDDASVAPEATPSGDDANDAPGDDGDDADASDGGDDSSDGPAGEAGDAGCPTAPPAGATQCCQDIACSGNCLDAGCSTCLSKCTTGDLCCVKGASVTCRQFSQGCP